MTTNDYMNEVVLAAYFRKLTFRYGVEPLLVLLRERFGGYPTQDEVVEECRRMEGL